MPPSPNEPFAMFTFGLDRHSATGSPAALQLGFEFECQLAGSEGSLVNTVEGRFEGKGNGHVFGRLGYLNHPVARP